MQEYTQGTTDGEIEEIAPGSLAVRVRVSSNGNVEPSLAYLLQVDVTAAESIDPNIFVFEGVSSVPGRAADQLRFVTVATPAHLAELPIGEPNPEVSGYYCRQSSLALYYRTAAALEAGRAGILRRVRMLLESLETLATIGEDTTTVFEFNTLNDSSSSE